MEVEETATLHAPDPRGFFERTLARLFPEQGWPPLPDEPPPGLPGVLRTEAFVFVGWKSRLRVLLSGRIVVKVQTLTDVVIGKAETTSTSSAVARGPRVFMHGRAA